jgi:pyridoxamine 5'-phosphate oxidase
LSLLAVNTLAAEKFRENFLKSTCIPRNTRYTSFVPLKDDFGDWATPKKSMAGHFFALYLTYNTQGPRKLSADPIFLSNLLLNKMSSVDPKLSTNTKILRKRDMAAHPMVQFERWLDEAVAAKIRQPEAMTLATATPDGRPGARMVLLRGCDERGFVFFTNYDGRKAGELGVNPWAALVFYWEALDRQVRVEGPVEKTTGAESDEYFYSRPRGSCIGAWASPQSEVLASRAVLEQRVGEAEARFAGLERVPRPPNWGGFRVLPHFVEFWQGQPNRLHDRLRYRLVADGAWLLERLAP